jgi:cytochrome c oxidase subunit 4
MQDSSGKHHLVSYGTYLLTWFALLLLTALTVTVAGMHLGGLSILGAILIASAKATIVLLIFMHLRYEARVFRIMVVVVLVTLAVFIGLTFLDISFR